MQKIPVFEVRYVICGQPPPYTTEEFVVVFHPCVSVQGPKQLHISCLNGQCHIVDPQGK